MRVVRENARSYNTLVMRWIWGGILLTFLATFNQQLVWAGGNGVERGPIFSWGSHRHALADNEARELVEKKIREECPALAEQDPEKPVIVSKMVEFAKDPSEQQGDRHPTKRFLVELRRDTDGKKHDLAVIVETRRELSKRHDVMVIQMSDSESDCKR